MKGNRKLVPRKGMKQGKCWCSVRMPHSGSFLGDRALYLGPGLLWQKRRPRCGSGPLGWPPLVQSQSVGLAASQQSLQCKF